MEQPFPYKVIYRGKATAEFVIAQFVMRSDRDAFMRVNKNPRYFVRDDEMVES